MDKIHVELINKNLDKLVAKTHSLEEIVAKLKEEKVLNHYMAKYIFEVSIVYKFPSLSIQFLAGIIS